jgi:hypothetical protein
MAENNLTDSSLSLAPLGAGDLIDRAVRFYRKNFWTFVGIAAPPVFVGTFFSIFWGYLGRTLFNVGTSRDETELGLYYTFLGLGTILILFVESVAVLSVMGGASRNFVRHLLFGESITFRETYLNVKNRLFGLIAASAILVSIFFCAGWVALFVGVFLAAILIGIASLIFAFSPLLLTIVSVVLSLVTAFFTIWLFFLLMSRLSYVPQIMLVEGQGVFAAIGRSISLASGNVKRLAALFIFTLVATYSALALLYIPLGWYAWANGVDIMAFDSDVVPLWYEVANQIVSQISFILLMPVLMTGLCLLYVDERVRHEGYDIELMAAKRLGDIPKVPPTFANPLQPALANQTFTQITEKNSSMTSLGLNSD